MCSSDLDEAEEATHTEYERRAVKIEDITEEEVDQSDAHNASIIAGSDAGDDEDEYNSEPTIKEKSLFKSIISHQDKKSK